MESAAAVAASTVAVPVVTDVVAKVSAAAVVLVTAVVKKFRKRRYESKSDPPVVEGRFVILVPVVAKEGQPGAGDVLYYCEKTDGDCDNEEHNKLPALSKQAWAL
mmetsp:Transcript_17742/g.41113  ORF Transcript_17742/g.41113 Transcript_17742/m.41113 type:complete len:105 (+) Transcript_17742:2-316(+)